MSDPTIYALCGTCLVCVLVLRDVAVRYLAAWKPQRELIESVAELEERVKRTELNVSGAFGRRRA